MSEFLQASAKSWVRGGGSATGTGERSWGDGGDRVVPGGEQISDVPLGTGVREVPKSGLYARLVTRHARQDCDSSPAVADLFSKFGQRRKGGAAGRGGHGLKGAGEVGPPVFEGSVSTGPKGLLGPGGLPSRTGSLLGTYLKVEEGAHAGPCSFDVRVGG